MRILLAALALALAAAPFALALPADPADLVQRTQQAIGDASADPAGTVSDPAGLAGGLLDSPVQDGGGVPKEGIDPGFADRVRDSFGDSLLLAGATTLVAAGLGLAGFAFVTRYVDPKVALANPQRSMLYGFIRGNPGVHLKKLSDEFGMKTSSILWHIRKLESAELVRSDRANGFRVFYPVEGGQLVKQVSRAVTALQNGNARRLFEHVDLHPGALASDVAAATGIPAATVRWHLRKLKEFDLVDEVEKEGQTFFFGTAVGHKALQTLLGAPGGAGIANTVPVALMQR